MGDAYQKFVASQVDRSRTFNRFLENVPQGGDYALFHGLSGSARALVVGRLAQRLERPVLVVTADGESAESWYDDLLFFGVEGAMHFPMTETLAYESEEPMMGIVARQYEALHYILTGESAQTNASAQLVRRGALPLVMVVPVEALQKKVLSQKAMAENTLTFQWGDIFDVDDAIRHLVDMGYDRQSMTETRGEFSVRGHIVDVFPPQLDFPVRFDLFDNEIEAMRYFDPGTQRSLPDRQELERVLVLPVSVWALCERLAREDVGAVVSLDKWLDESTLVVLDAPDKYATSMDQFDYMLAKRYEELTGGVVRDSAGVGLEESDIVTHGAVGQDGSVLSPDRLYLSRSQVEKFFHPFAQVHIPRFDFQDASGPTVFDFGVTSYDTISPDVEAYLSVIRKRQLQDFSVHLICDNNGQVTRLHELMSEREIANSEVKPEGDAGKHFVRRDPLEGYQEVSLVVGVMHTGFIFPDAQLMLVTDREMFGRYKRRHVYRKVAKGRAITSISEILRGDLIVHVDHGLGRFLGIRTQEIDGRKTELLEIEYGGDSKLLVPIDNVDRIQKYSSVQEGTPALDRLGGKRWQTRKRKSLERIELMAQELLGIYARREAARGHAFSPDSVWQREFEESFLYTETGDQMRSINEIKKDMCDCKPMDRLLCGDVGFGKTEVAMRAAFKCVEEKKQVAVLVPTTILAQQHYHTFCERFADYPVNVGVVSRFQTAAQQHETIAKLKTGEVQVVIGTHRLLSKDLGFLDLGLLIVDEEHRFGVRQKEKIKSFRASVDILTLSATPVPRTLHMALSGLRDMSTINTPPRDRLPVRTRVIRFSSDEIEEAVVRELNRGGQIYFVHNRVQSIEAVAQRIRDIVPQARIAIGHGQMPERELEQVMIDFIDRKYDLLLATTIIESGLDIPNVNTIIINRADAFGLAQLYQLRGRVGRDVKRAYAYLIVPEGRPITETAIKRLRAIEEFTDLGSGFQIAMRDLEIRGTGNILGSEQHGTIEAIGFELYCQMLEEAVQNLRGEVQVSAQPVEIKWDVSAFLPADYVPVESQRIAFYRRCSSAREVVELEEMAAELRDRYGSIPLQAKNLIDVSRMRLLARKCQLEAVIGTPSGFKVKPRGDMFDFMRRTMENKGHLPGVEDVGATGDGKVFLKMSGWKISQGIERACEVLEALKQG